MVIDNSFTSSLVSQAVSVRQANLRDQITMAVLTQAMNGEKAMAAQLIEMMWDSPHLGQNMDVRA